MTSDVINLNKVRKAKAKATRTKEASENRAKFGRSKRERQQELANDSLADKRMDGHRLGDSTQPKLATVDGQVKAGRDDEQG